jgi:hypothetical protein
MLPFLSFAFPFRIASLITKVNAPFCHSLDSSADCAHVAAEIVKLK